jgi:hypothetical protein
MLESRQTVRVAAYWTPNYVKAGSHCSDKAGPLGSAGHRTCFSQLLKLSISADVINAVSA